MAVCSLTCHTTTRTHMPYTITQCYLPPDRADIPAFTPAEAGTRLSDPRWMQDFVVFWCILEHSVCLYIIAGFGNFHSKLNLQNWRLWIGPCCVGASSVADIATWQNVGVYVHVTDRRTDRPCRCGRAWHRNVAGWMCFFFASSDGWCMFHVLRIICCVCWCRRTRVAILSRECVYGSLRRKRHVRSLDAWSEIR